MLILMNGYSISTLDSVSGNPNVLQHMPGSCGGVPVCHFWLIGHKAQKNRKIVNTSSNGEVMLMLK